MEKQIINLSVSIRDRPIWVFLAIDGRYMMQILGADILAPPIIMVSMLTTVRANPRLLGALCKTVSGGGGSSGYDRMNETHLSVFHSEKYVSSAARYAFN